MEAMSAGPAIPQVEREIAFDLIRRGIIVAPLIVAVRGAARLAGCHQLRYRGWTVALNFAVAAVIIPARAAPAHGIAVGACVGYLVRLGIVLVALIPLRHQPWIDLPVFGIVLVATHLGLLFWEMKYLSITLGAPALRPARPQPVEEMMKLAAVDVPPIPDVTIWARARRFQQDRVDLLLRDDRHDVLFCVGKRRNSWYQPACSRTRPSRGSASYATRSIMQTMGVEGLGYLPYLTALFFFIFFSNITEIIPGVQFPANARFGMPLVLALATWVIYNVVGVVKQGPLHYIKNSLIPPACRSRSSARDAHRARVDVLRAAVLVDGPALRQHARRPPHPRHLRHAVGGAVRGQGHRRDPAVLVLACSSR